MTDTNLKTLPKECFGTVFTTKTIRDQLPPSLLKRLLDRHFSNDWGDLDEHDVQMNVEAVHACDGHRVHSSYSWPKKVGLDQDVWIISYLHSDPYSQNDPNVCYTNVMFPSEY